MRLPMIMMMTTMKVPMESVWLQGAERGDALIFETGHRRVRRNDYSETTSDAPLDLATAVEETEKWAKLVADLRLCPWAERSLAGNACFYVASRGSLVRDALAAAAAELENIKSKEEPIVFAIFPDLDEDFLTFDELCEDLESLFLDEFDLQLAGFHPKWTYAGLEANDPLHFEKRAPHPTISLIRAASVKDAQAITATIATNNEDTLRDIGYEQLKDKYQHFCTHHHSAL